MLLNRNQLPAHALAYIPKTILRLGLGNTRTRYKGGVLQTQRIYIIWTNQEPELE